jgi:hypothetical protein
MESGISSTRIHHQPGGPSNLNLFHDVGAQNVPEIATKPSEYHPERVEDTGFVAGKQFEAPS